MCRAVATLFRQFPDIKRDITQVNQDTRPLISKIRKVRNDSISPLCVTICALHLSSNAY